MIKATDILKNDHRVIERVLGALEMGAARLRSGHPVRPGFFLDAADFIRSFADGWHHSKEERVLFPEMIASGLPDDGGPIAVMLSDHERGRQLAAGMREAAEQLAGGDGSAVDGLARNSEEYVALMREHIAKEDGVLFPMADQMYPAAEQEALAEAFGRIEREEVGDAVHQRYLGVAEALVAEAAR